MSKPFDKRMELKAFVTKNSSRPSFEEDLEEIVWDSRGFYKGSVWDARSNFNSFCENYGIQNRNQFAEVLCRKEKQ